MQTWGEEWVGGFTCLLSGKCLTWGLLSPLRSHLDLTYWHKGRWETKYPNIPYSLIFLNRLNAEHLPPSSASVVSGRVRFCRAPLTGFWVDDTMVKARGGSGNVEKEGYCFPVSQFTSRWHCWCSLARSCCVVQGSCWTCSPGTVSSWDGGSE